MSAFPCASVLLNGHDCSFWLDTAFPCNFVAHAALGKINNFTAHPSQQQTVTVRCPLTGAAHTTIGKTTILICNPTGEAKLFEFYVITEDLAFRDGTLGADVLAFAPGLLRLRRWNGRALQPRRRQRAPPPGVYAPCRAGSHTLLTATKLHANKDTVRLLSLFLPANIHVAPPRPANRRAAAGHPLLNIPDLPTM